MAEKLTNWAGNIEYGALLVHRPSTVDELRDIVAGSRNVRAVGTRHSFNHIADTEHDLLSTERLNRVLELIPETGEVVVESGARYGELCRLLAEHGRALHNLASLPHISIGGACATATHGSGDRNACLGDAVEALEIVTADGGLRTFRRRQDPSDFDGVVVGLGAAGVVTKLWLRTQPAFEIRQDVYVDLPLESVLAQYDAIAASAYSVSLFTHWRDETVAQVWLKRSAADAGSALPESMRAVARAAGPLHPIREMSPDHCTEQMGVPGLWHERLPHFRLEFTPSCGEELQTEYLVPRHYAVQALKAVSRISAMIAPQLQVSEIRTIAADRYWMSPFYHQPCVGIHFTWLPDWPAVSRILPQIEAALEPYEPRPHWGKLFTSAPDRVARRYPMLPAFRDLVLSCDPEGKFRNAFTERYIFNAAV